MSHFKITQRHYDIVIKQAIDNFPQESGGCFGGDDFSIKAILPLFNQHLYDKTDTFAFTSDDVNRAHRFFAKHNLKYFGLYHSHPSGIAYPSQQDIDTGHKYHFIIGLKSKEDTPVLNVFEIKNKKVYQLELEIITKNYEAIDIHSSKPKTDEQLGIFSEAEFLSEQIQDIKNEAPKYKRLDPKDRFNSDFSTLA